MEAVLLIIHLMVAIALVVTILLQRSEGGALGIGGGSGSFLTARGAGDVLTRTTKWLAIIFLANSLLLGWMAEHRQDDKKILEKAETQKPTPKKGGLPEIPTVPADGKN
ncbi:preprotein translocase subunit SecG [Kordiimonas marina]|uniref:preprotein translocase subunit SecG n=1 Tax=Kordiimonas marina TaxID=2872312 RepID=UPI001FF56C63|nr:preprotein translocase subunit SecG [Kordiimonas marina]MCJ9428774.1 preprotein translocase subunit SecG [Kordiimonas marina]